MGKYIDNINDIDCTIELIEVMEIKSENTHIKKLQETAWAELKEIFGSTTNPDYWLRLILEARARLTKR